MSRARVCHVRRARGGRVGKWARSVGASGRAGARDCVAKEGRQHVGACHVGILVHAVSSPSHSDSVSVSEYVSPSFPLPRAPWACASCSECSIQSAASHRAAARTVRPWPDMAPMCAESMPSAVAFYWDCHKVGRNPEFNRVILSTKRSVPNQMLIVLMTRSA